MKRGEIWTVAGGHDYAGKPRPAVVIQGNHTNFFYSAVVCLFTTDGSKTSMVRPKIEPNSRNGLSASSYLMVDKITTMPQDKIARKIGELDEADMVVLNREILDFLELTDFSYYP